LQCGKVSSINVKYSDYDMLGVQIVQDSPFLTMDLLESCFPYALLRTSYHHVYRHAESLWHCNINFCCFVHTSCICVYIYWKKVSPYIRFCNSDKQWSIWQIFWGSVTPVIKIFPKENRYSFTTVQIIFFYLALVMRCRGLLFSGQCIYKMYFLAAKFNYVSQLATWHFVV